VPASILELLSSPKEYDGKGVVVVGFAQLEFESQALFFHREDCEQGLLTNALWVDVDLKPEFKALNGRYVLVEGVLDAKHAGLGGAFRGAIRRVHRYEAWPTAAERAKRLGAPKE
jgi:hypothetical protein